MKITATIQGIRPLLLHNGRLTDPLDEYSQKLKELSKLRNKSEETHKKMAEIEWLAGLYWSKDLGVYLPADNIEAMLAAAAKRVKMGNQAKVGIMCDTDKFGFSLDYDGPKNLDELQANPRFRLRRACSIQKNKIMRTRPMFPVGWHSTLHLEVDKELFNPKDVEQILNLAGQFHGLGTWRPKFGRFIVTDFQVEKEAKA